VVKSGRCDYRQVGVPSVTTAYVMTGGVLMLISYCSNVYYCNFHANKGKIFPAHAMVAYGRGGTVLLILKFGTTWAKVVRFTSRDVLPSAKRALIPIE
jgi:hypothetical protein